MRFIIVLILLAFVAVPLTGCSGCNPGPVISFRNPVQFDKEPGSVAGPRLMAVPQYAAPTYQFQNYGCQPAAPGYSVAPPPAAAPCTPAP